MSETCRCYGGAAPTPHPTPQVQEGLRGVGGSHIRSSSSASHISPRAGGGQGWGMMGAASAFLSDQRQRPRVGGMKLLLLLLILTIINSRSF